MTPDQTLWPLAEHTRGKHLVLRRYLDAWLPIMATGNQRILFIDGFAGPGRYTGGEDGSPVIALKALREHNHRHRMNAQVAFVFIEKEADRVAHLRTEVAPYSQNLGSRVVIDVLHGKFDETMSAALDSVDAQSRRLAPAFVMVDPFGVSDTPMAVLERVLRNPKCELYVSFMWEFFNRFKESDEFPPHLDSLFGTDAWRPLARIPNWRERKARIFALYRAELKRRGAKHVVHFELYEGASLIYAIFFATKHELGCDKMKEAIWHVDPFGGHAFVPGSNDALQLFGSAELGPLKAGLRAKFGGTPTSVEAVRAWVQSDETYFYSGQLKKALRELEDAHELVVRAGTRRKARSFPDGTVLVLTPL